MQKLSQEDLFSLILGETEKTGSSVLGQMSNLRTLSLLEVHDFLSMGLNPQTAVRVLAAIELGWRVSQSPWQAGEIFQGSSQVFRSFRADLGRETVEVVWVLLLDARLRKMDAIEISRGTVTGAIVHPREVLRPVITRQAAAFILLHNHPSGDPTPSEADFLITRQIAKAAEIFRVDFLDHLIVTPQTYYSLADHRQM